MKLSTLSFWVSIGLLSSPVFAQDEPNKSSLSVVLAMNYKNGLDTDAYWASEKLDGIRAYWTGSEFLTRTGHKIAAPEWFIKSLPKREIDGELWAGRGGFQDVAKTVLDSQPDDELWQHISFMMFDLPHAEGIFPQRYSDLSEIVEGLNQPHLQLVKHYPIINEETLLEALELISSENGEGLMLRKIDAVYKAGRSNDLIKLKKHQDDEAIVIGYTNGKGKYEGMVGALILKMPNGIEFKIGSGLSDKVRANPPELGAKVTYRYNGFTDDGIPRFARYVAIRKNY